MAKEPAKIINYSTLTVWLSHFPKYGKTIPEIATKFGLTEGQARHQLSIMFKEEKLNKLTINGNTRYKFIEE